MASWSEVEREAPELAAEVRARFAAARHHTLATLRADGGPRISGTEVDFADGQVWLGSMPGARKALDLRRDPRFALHSATVDPPPGDDEGWPGEAKMSGQAVDVSAPDAEDGAHRFRLELTELVLTRVRAGQLEITSWHPGRGVEVVRRT